ncbi:MAG: peptide chain release factor 3 [Elusimicrobia bacterium]|nr:peptide chain release factor 3 [Elusimicrobiota bacterium]
MNEIARRRTFAIISHPDAGKTTLTEKLLLYGGAVQLAGSVTARKNQRATTSDWMELEKKRGISVSSTVLQFDYGDFRINLLDTPGHRDFSEDTYRVLTAVDSVIMVIDAAKGIESQTRKLFEVCRQRRVPIFTFMNKLDRPTKDPLELIDELEKVLGLHPFPMNWPLGTGVDFRGVYDRVSGQAHLFERTPGGAFQAPVAVHDPSDPIFKEQMDPISYRKFVEDVAMLDGAGARLDSAAISAGNTTPVYFGSASNNFGVQLLLEGFLSCSPPPAPRSTSLGLISPDQPAFSGFIFKIQGNMDPRHRDRVAFLRICSGKFTREMVVLHPRTGKRVKLSNVHKIFGREREVIDEAYPGDILGLAGHSDFSIGDTLSEDPRIVYNEIPRFPPECFAFLHNTSPVKFKPFRKGLEQSVLEGIVQPFSVQNTPYAAPLLAAVGPLQFEVLQYRLQSEYGVETRLENAPWELVRWVDPSGKDHLIENSVTLPSGSRLGEDAAGETVVFFPNEWALRYFAKRSPDIKLHELPPKRA